MIDHMIKENAAVGLHDCRTDSIRYGDQTVAFYFPDGYYLMDGSEPKRTGKAEMRCRILDGDIDGFSVFIYRKGPRGKVIREDWSENFPTAVSDGTFEFEFVTAYRGYQRMLFKGYVWFDKAPYHMECEIEIRTDEVTYSWEEQQTSGLLQ